MESQQSYYARRAGAERNAARRAKDARARHAHLDLAARFDQLAAVVGEVDREVGPEERPVERRFASGLIQF